VNGFNFSFLFLIVVYQFRLWFSPKVPKLLSSRQHAQVSNRSRGFPAWEWRGASSLCWRSYGANWSLCHYWRSHTWQKRRVKFSLRGRIWGCLSLTQSRQYLLNIKYHFRGYCGKGFVTDVTQFGGGCRNFTESSAGRLNFGPPVCILRVYVDNVVKSHDAYPTLWWS
jgi:hypothetical protein